MPINKILLKDNFPSFPDLHLQGFPSFFLPNSLVLLFAFILQPSLHPTNYPHHKSSHVNHAFPCARWHLPANTHRAVSWPKIWLLPGFSLPVCDHDLLPPTRKCWALPAGNCVWCLHIYSGCNDGPWCCSNTQKQVAEDRILLGGPTLI